MKTPKRARMTGYATTTTAKRSAETVAVVPPVPAASLAPVLDLPDDDLGNTEEIELDKMEEKPETKRRMKAKPKSKPKARPAAKKAAPTRAKAKRPSGGIQSPKESKRLPGQPAKNRR